MNQYRKTNGKWCVVVDRNDLKPGDAVAVTTRKGKVKIETLGRHIAPFTFLLARNGEDLDEAATDASSAAMTAVATPPATAGDLLDALDLPAPQPATAPAPAPQPAPQTEAPATTGKAAKAQRVMELFGELIETRGDEATIRRIVQEEIGKAASITRIEVKNRAGKLATLQEHFHPLFPVLCKMASSFGRDGYVPGIWIAGEASSGKTFAGSQLARALSLPFHFNGAISQPHEMLGFIDGTGRYHRTPFREAYEHGGIYVFDECDRADPNALLAVNPHLANGIAEFPDGQIKRHPDCVIIATANTWGTGADSAYVGATKLDAAFLSRFPMRLSWNIDEGFERAIVGNDRWCDRVQAARKRAKAAGLKVMIDVRTNLAGAAMIDAGFTDDEAAQRTYLANVKPEQASMIEVAR